MGRPAEFGRPGSQPRSTVVSVRAGHRFSGQEFQGNDREASRFMILGCFPGSDLHGPGRPQPPPARRDRARICPVTAPLKGLGRYPGRSGLLQTQTNSRRRATFGFVRCATVRAEDRYKHFVRVAADGAVRLHRANGRAGRSSITLVALVPLVSLSPLSPLVAFVLPSRPCHLFRLWRPFRPCHLWPPDPFGPLAPLASLWPCAPCGPGNP